MPRVAAGVQVQACEGREQVEMARSMLASPNLSARQVAQQLGVHRSTLYRSLAAR